MVPPPTTRLWMTIRSPLRAVGMSRQSGLIESDKVVMLLPFPDRDQSGPPMITSAYGYTRCIAVEPILYGLAAGCVRPERGHPATEPNRVDWSYRGARMGGCSYVCGSWTVASSWLHFWHRLAWPGAFPASNGTGQLH